MIMDYWKVIDILENYHREKHKDYKITIQREVLGTNKIHLPGHPFHGPWDIPE